MRIAFRKNDGQAEIIRVWSAQERVEVPAQLGDCKVTAIAPYAFSAHKGAEEEACLWEREEGGQEILRCAEAVCEIHLPETVQTIGNYAFYGCRNMKVFHGTDRITRMGSGVFTGCRLSRVEIDFYDGDKSCLKEILTDIRYGITAVLRKGRETEARVIFPEFYADAVENTPARIVETHYYGSGGDYRECFYRRELDFRKYDSMFVLSAARDESKVTAELALARLMYPLKLEDAARENYEAYVREHMEEIARICLAHLEHNTELSIAGPMEALRFCCAGRYFSREALDAGINAASETGQTEALSILMDARQRQFPRKKKTFEL